MSADLARRQMTIDIAHALRNPQTVIGGYLDALHTGHLQPTPTRLEAIDDELQHLECLVDDLRTLSLADAGALALNRQPLAPRGLLNRIASIKSNAKWKLSMTPQSLFGSADSSTRSFFV